ncbi:MAG: EipA family protein [Novosphingobium sp.]|nr:EipA family protein [Novosphingobium sp.]
MGISKFARGAMVAGVVALALSAGASAQAIQAIDPNQGMAADIAPSGGNAQPVPGADYATPVGSEAGTIPALPAETPAPSQPATPAAQSQGATYHEDDVIGAAEGVFGKGAEGLANLIADLLKKQGEPNGYIVGREAGGAFVVGLRYGSGTLFHKVEGQRPVYWTGPSIGFDAGANAGKTFVLVYNLYDSQDLYKRFPAGEGQAYVLGGFNASYMRQGDVVLIPVRMGVGLRLGVNAGYMKFSKSAKWMPF